MTTPIDYFRSTVAENRFIQGSWNRRVEGKDYVCLAAAWGKPGTINSVGDCPVNLFPRWVFELMPTLDDGVAPVEVPWLFRGFAERADKMAAFTPDQWDAVQSAFLIGVIDVALDAARPVQPSPAPAYWTQVEDACSQVKAALKSGDKTEAWAAAARAAAGWAAAAEAAAGWAAAAAEAAARAAARAAAAAEAAAAGWAARAAYKQIASVFFASVDAQ